MYCSIARTLDVVGEGWTLLILRDVLGGLRRFDELQKSLGIATNVLAARLKRLTEQGLLERRAYRERPTRFEYLPTGKAIDLCPVLIGLLQWGDKHLAGEAGPPRRLVHAGCGHPTRPELFCSECREPIGPRGIRLLGPLRAKAAT
jgi:DNA-binding HxlR family transcriptional regulator